MHRADVVRVTAALAVLTGLAAAWRWTPLGASPVGFGSMVLGTALGLVPAVTALALLGESVTRALRQPSVGAIALGLVVVAAVAVTAALVGRHLLDREETR